MLHNYLGRFKENLVYKLGWTVTKIIFSDQLLIFLMKIRHNYKYHLCKLFNCSQTTISNIVLTFLYLFHETVYEPLFHIPSRDFNKTSMPESFALFKNCRIIIDCTDVKITTPRNMNEQALSYSFYRGMNSYKILVGVAPNGTITFVSDPYPGSTSDKAIVAHCGLVQKLHRGDLILADKGFLIEDLLPERVTVNIPPFLHNQFTPSEALTTEAIARGGPVHEFM